MTELTKSEGADEATPPSTDPAVVLTDAEAEASRRDYGNNHFSELPVPTLIELVEAAVQDPMLISLIVCALVALFVGAIGGEPSELIDGIAITIAVLVVTGVGVRNQIKAQQDYAALDAVASKERVRVIRNGGVVDLDGDEIVRGDVL